MPLPFPQLDYPHIEKRYPKAVEKVSEWLFSHEELTAQLKSQVDAKDCEAAKRHFCGLLIQMDPRKLYDVFDALKIHISITYTPIQGIWSYSNNEGDMYTTTSRHEAEISAFHDAFEVLENQ